MMTSNTTTSQQHVLEHLSELRGRLIKIILFIFGGAIIGLIFCKEIFHTLQIPMQQALPAGSFFIATNPFESYSTYFKIALVAGIFISSPFIFLQAWKFLAPGLKTHEKKWVLPIVISSTLLFVGGALFGYFIVFPAGFYYMNLVLEGTGVHFLPKMSDYLSLAFTLLFIFGITFEMPLFIFILGKLGIIEYEHIKKYRRYVIVFLFVLAAVLTPGPDVLSQCLLAFPLWILYELGGLVLLLNKK